MQLVRHHASVDAVRERSDQRLQHAADQRLAADRRTVQRHHELRQLLRQ